MLHHSGKRVKVHLLRIRAHRALTCRQRYESVVTREYERASWTKRIFLNSLKQICRKSTEPQLLNGLMIRNGSGSRPSDSRKSSQETRLGLSFAIGAQEYTLAGNGEFPPRHLAFPLLQRRFIAWNATHATQKNLRGGGEGREGESQRNRRSSISGSETRITILPPRLLQCYRLYANC